MSLSDFALSILRRYTKRAEKVAPPKSDDFEHHRHILELANLWYYSDIRKTYWEAIYDAVFGYLNSTASIVSFRNAARRACADAYVAASEQAWQDAGAKLPIDDGDALSYIASAQAAELGFIDDAFARLVLFRKEMGDMAPFAAQEEAANRADGFAHTLDGLYANVKLLAKPSVMLTFAGTDGMESCKDCSRYKGQRHRAKWWVARDAVPPSRHFECKGYRCQHHLVDDDGNLYTI